MTNEQTIAEIEMVRTKLKLMGHMDSNRDKALCRAVKALEMQIAMKENLADENMCNNMILKKFILS